MRFLVLTALVASLAIVLAALRVDRAGHGAAEPAASDIAAAVELDTVELVHPSGLALELERGAARRVPLAEVSEELEARLGATLGGLPPDELYSRFFKLREKIALETHELARARFAAGEGKPHSRNGEEIDGPVAFFVEKKAPRRLMRVDIPAKDEPELWLQYAEMRWIERELNSFRWSVDEMQTLATTDFKPAGEAHDLRHEYLDSMRDLDGLRQRKESARKSTDSASRGEADAAPIEPEPKDYLRKAEPANGEELAVARVASARSAYIARRRVALRAEAEAAEAAEAAINR